MARRPDGCTRSAGLREYPEWTAGDVDARRTTPPIRRAAHYRAAPSRPCRSHGSCNLPAASFIKVLHRSTEVQRQQDGGGHAVEQGGGHSGIAVGPAYCIVRFERVEALDEAG